MAPANLREKQYIILNKRYGPSLLPQLFMLSKLHKGKPQAAFVPAQSTARAKQTKCTTRLNIRLNILNAHA